MTGNKVHSGADGETRPGIEGPPSDRWRRSWIGVGVGVALVLAVAFLGSEAIETVYYDWLTGTDPATPATLVGTVAAGTAFGLRWTLLPLGVLVGAFAAVRNADRPVRASLLAALGVGASVALLAGTLHGVTTLLPGGPTAQELPGRIVAAVGAGVVSGAITAGSGWVVGALGPRTERASAFDRPAPGIAPAAFGAGAIVAVGIGGGLTQLFADLGLVELGLDAGLPSVRSFLVDWEAVFFDETVGGVLVGLVAGATWNRRHLWKPTVAAGAGYFTLVGGALLVATTVDPGYSASDPVAIGFGDVVVGSIQVLVVAGAAAYGVDHLAALARGATTEGSDEVGATSDGLGRFSAGRTLALFCGLFLVTGFGFALDGAVRFALLSPELGTALLDGVEFSLHHGSLGAAAAIAVVYALVTGEASPRSVGITALVGTTAGYLIAAELSLLLFSLTGPASVETVWVEVVGAAAPAVGVAVVAGSVAALTAAVVRGGQKASGSAPA